MTTAIHKEIYKRKLFSFLYPILLLCIALYISRKPEYNWDMLPYMGVILSYDGTSVEKIHGDVYQTAKQEIPASVYEQLTDSNNPYRFAAARNAEIFHDQFPFYVVKPLYTGLCWLLYKCGIALTISTVWPSIAGYFLIGILLFHWIQQYKSQFFACCASIVIMHTTPLMSVGKISTPDALSGLFIFAAVYALVEKRSFLLGMLCFLFSVCTRIDNIIPAVLLLTAYRISTAIIPQLSTKKFFMGIGLLLAATCCVSLGSHAFGWSIFYYPDFARQLNTNYTHKETFVLKDYVALAKSQLMTGLYHSSVLIFGLLGLFLFSGLSKFKFQAVSIEQTFTLVFAVIMLVRFLLQPLVADRIYIPYYLLVTVFLVKKYSLAGKQNVLA